MKELNGRSILRKLRETQRISQRALSTMSEISRGRLRSLEEKGVEGATFHELKRICNALQIEIADLLQKDSASDKSDYFVQRGEPIFQIINTEAGYKMFSFVPLCQDFFVGKLLVFPTQKISEIEFPWAKAVFVQMFLGGFHMRIGRENYELREGDSIKFYTNMDYEIKNAFPRDSVALVFTVPGLIQQSQ